MHCGRIQVELSLLGATETHKTLSTLELHGGRRHQDDDNDDCDNFWTIK